MTKKRVAVVQTSPVPNDRTATVEKLIEFAAKARAAEAGLVLFPEAFIGGYPKGAAFGVALGSRTPEGREEFRHYHNNAIDVPGPETERIASAASELGIFIVVGVIEREGGTLYCTALFFAPSGEMVGKHRKLMPTAAERYIWGQGDGSTLPVYDSGVGKVGAVICWENYMPMLRMAMYGKGIEIYCAPTADDRPTWLPTMQHVALEGRCFVLSSCQVLRRRDFPEGFRNEISNDPDTMLMRGGSVIIDPLGKVLAGPVFDEDAVLTADIDLDDIVRAKFDFDPCGHYSRPDVFRLLVNEGPMVPITTSS